MWWLLLPALIICIYGIIALWPEKDNSYLTAEHTVNADSEEAVEHLSGWEAVPDAENSEVIPELSEHVVFMEKRSGMKLSLVSREGNTAVFELEGLTNDSFDSSYVKCVTEGNYDNGKNEILADEKTFLSDLSVEIREEETRTYTAVITVTTKEYTEYSLREDEHYFFIDAGAASQNAVSGTGENGT